MNTLIIDTSTTIEFLSVTNHKKTHFFTENVGKNHSTDLFLNLKNLLEESKLNITDIDLIGVGIGPGSFTGVRIAVTTARMLAQILTVPLVGIKSHEIYASSVKTTTGSTILTAFDAKKGRVFGGLYQKEDDGISILTDAGDFTIESLTNQVNNCKNLICIGDGCEKFIDSIVTAGNIKGFHVNYLENFKPSGDVVAKLIIKRYSEFPEKFSNYNTIVPFYARKSDAEIARDNNKS